MSREGEFQPNTYFASPERASAAEIAALAGQVNGDPILSVVIKSIGGYLMLLDGHRQIVAANDRLYELLGVAQGQSIAGLRYGEALGCINVPRGPSGCGTSPQCRHCGAVLSVLAAQAREEAIEGECTLTCCRLGSPTLQDYRLYLCPIKVGTWPLLAVVFHDITAQKWRALHEQLFVHDLGNLLTGLSGWCHELGGPDADTAAQELVEISSRLNEHLSAHRLLMRCEAGIQVVKEVIAFDDLARSLEALFGARASVYGPKLRIDLCVQTATLVSDKRLLLRVLENLVKNACEACPEGESVSVRFETLGQHSVFRIHHPGVMSPEVSARMFSPLFSTKGPGRGLGMYTVQVLGEHLLGGQVSWHSSEERGTVFHFALPNP